MVGVAVISVSQPCCRTGFIYASYVTFITDLELPHLAHASLFRTYSFLLGFSAVFSMWFLRVSFPSRYVSKYLTSCVFTTGSLLISTWIVVCSWLGEDLTECSLCICCHCIFIIPITKGS
jgi:hypothetical protein